MLLRELEAEDADGQTGAGETSLSWGAGGRFAVVINHDPLRLEWYVNDRLVITANDKSKLSFEGMPPPLLLFVVPCDMRVRVCGSG